MEYLGGLAHSPSQLSKGDETLFLHSPLPIDNYDTNPGEEMKALHLDEVSFDRDIRYPITYRINPCDDRLLGVDT
jgi:hypothetical protein